MPETATVPLIISALNVPVRGAVPAVSGVTPAELITVLAKLTPATSVPPIYLSRLRIRPLGAFKLKIISPTHVCVMLIVTLRPVIVALAGMPATANVCVAPAALPSGTGTAIVPDATETVTGGGGGKNCVLNCIGVPAQTDGLAGVITGTGGLEFTITVVVYASLLVSGSLLAGVVAVATVTVYAPPTEKLKDGLR